MATTVANILTAIGYRVFSDGTGISSSTEPSETECIRWVNETCEELLTVCIESKTEIGRSLGEITLADGTASYDDLDDVLFSPVIMRDSDGEQFSGWILKTNARNPLVLGIEADLIGFDPALESEPTSFHIDGSNNVIFRPIPDDEYTAEIPYYPYHTMLTATTDTIPFLRVFDHVITESVTMRAQNREEYDLSFELKWYSYIRKQARKIIAMRKNDTVRFVN